MTDVSGYCAECGRFLPIEARGTHPGSRAQRWYPVRHPKPNDDTGGEDCPGMKRAL